MFAKYELQQSAFFSLFVRVLSLWIILVGISRLFIKGFSDSFPSLLHIIFMHVKDMKIIIAFRNFDVNLNVLYILTHWIRLFLVTKLGSVFGIFNSLEYLSEFLFIFLNKTLFIHGWTLCFLMLNFTNLVDMCSFFHIF